MRKNQLYCGAAKKNITPSEELLPDLFGLMGQKYGRVHDELFLRVLALQNGETKGMIVIYDLDKATNPEEWTKALEEETGIPVDNILYLAIHTHTAPLTGYRPFEGPNFVERKSPEEQRAVHQYEAFLKSQLLTAAKEAISAMVPVKMGYGTGKCHIGINRCRQYDVVGENGEILPEMNIGFDPDGIADPTLLVLRFEDLETGKPIAFFTNYAVHCVAAFQNTCDDGKAFLSADIGGTVSSEIEKEYPGSVALWSSAPAGDINPSRMIQNFYPDPETGKPVQRCIQGEDAADVTLKVMAYDELAAIRKAMRSITCDITDAPLKASITWARTKRAEDGFISETPAFDKDYEIRLHLLQIGPLALIGVDGELYTSLGQAIKAVSPVADTFVLNHEASLLLNNPGYIMDDAMMARLKACSGRGAQRGGVPGGGVYTKPGAVKAALEEAAKALWQDGKTEKYFDWSCKKDILLKGPDGRLLPMSEPFYSARQIAPDTWQIVSSGDYSYLLKGDGQGLLIDSGYGAGNIREYCEKLCGVPVPWIANTHEHFDHTANNGYFDLVYISKKAYENATVPFASFAGVSFKKDYPVQFVKTGDVIPLPGRELLCFELGDHAEGSIAYLDKQSNILFSGDELWHTKPLRGKPADFAAKLEVIKEYRDAFDMLYAGNGQYGAGVLDKLLACCKRAAAGELGEPAPEDLGLLGAWEDRLEDGTVVYDRMRPHMGDGKAGKKNPDQDKLRCITEKGVRLIFLPSADAE